MAYLYFPLKPLQERYKVTLTWGVQATSGYREVEPIDISQMLLIPAHTIFGRNAPETSELHKYTLGNKSVSKQQGAFGYSKDGYLVCQRIGDSPLSIVDAEGIPRPVEKGHTQILVRAHRDGPTEEAQAYCGGDDGKLFRGNLELKKKEATK